jgi:hypothetical protein
MVHKRRQIENNNEFSTKRERCGKNTHTSTIETVVKDFVDAIRNLIKLEEWQNLKFECEILDDPVYFYIYVHDSILDLQCHRGIACENPHINMWCFGDSDKVIDFVSDPLIYRLWENLNLFPDIKLNWYA